MRLKFNTPYLSIDDFNPVELPDFTVVTGVNGSGKSHLLQAIEKGHATIEGVQKTSIVLFNYETFKLENESAFNATQIAGEREQAWQFYEQNVRKQANRWHVALGTNYEHLKELCVKDDASLFNATLDQSDKYSASVSQFFSPDLVRNNPQALGIFAIAKNLPYGLHEITKDEFERLYRPFAVKNDFLPTQLGKVFWDYYVKFYRNQVNEFQNERHGDSLEALTASDFEKKHGRKPWDVINEILTGFDSLSYRVGSPEGSDVFKNFHLRLLHTSKPGLEIDFSSLSSGERVLMALVASIYKSSADKRFPRLLLLDEVDASLHPSMMQNMLDVIKKVFLQHHVKVVLITHSPTTVALAPEESIFLMNRTGPDRIEKKSKQEALKVLTQGFATLEEGLKLFDEVARSNVTLITEGHNVSIIESLLRLNGISDVQLIKGLEGVTGKSQLKTLYQFFAKVQHKNKVIFVWDCDAPSGQSPENNTYPFTLPQNSANTVVDRGIENAFPEHLFGLFLKTTTLSDGKVIRQFDEARKKDFAAHIVKNGSIQDFVHFTSLVNEINRIRLLP